MKPVFKSLMHFVHCRSLYHKFVRPWSLNPEFHDLNNVFRYALRESIKGYK